MPHELSVEAQPPAEVRASANDDVSTSVGKITDVALGKAWAAADYEVVFGWFNLGQGTDATESQNQKSAYQAFLHHENSPL
jgi:hypothetical protein